MCEFQCYISLNSLSLTHEDFSFLGWHWVNSTCTVLSGEVVRTAYSAHSGNLEKFEPGWFFGYNSLIGR